MMMASRGGDRVVDEGGKKGRGIWGFVRGMFGVGKK
jgi:hypothetical protein